MGAVPAFSFPRPRHRLHLHPRPRHRLHPRLRPRLCLHRRLRPRPRLRRRSPRPRPRHVAACSTSVTPCHVDSFTSIQVQRSVCSHTGLLFRPLQPFEPLVVSRFRVGGSAPSPSPSPRLPARPTGSTGSSPWPLLIALSLVPTS